MITLRDAWESDKILRKALNMNYSMGGGSIGMKYPSTIRFCQGVQIASNFRPGYALHMYRKYCVLNGTIFDTSAGHGGRMVGFMAFGKESRYIGIDPHTKAHEGNTALAKDLRVSGRVELHCIPAEDMDPEVVRGRCDFAFTSPPYFSKEDYSNEPTQSLMRYPEANEWREKFLKKILALQYAALKPGCYSAINIADVKIKKDKVPLSQWVVEDAKEAGFLYVETLMYPISKTPGAHKDKMENTKFQGGPKAFEPIFLFRKPE
jgi:hypothetical protein